MEKYKEYVETLMKFIESKGIQLVKTNEYYALLFSNTISYNPRGKDEFRLYSLLHEMGHFNVEKSSRNLKFTTRIYAMLDSKTRKSDFHKVETIQDEVRAWDAGWTLSKKLGFKLDSTKYKKFSSKMLMTYIKWDNKKS